VRKYKNQNLPILSVIAFSVAILSMTVTMTLGNNNDMRSILKASIESDLISTSIAARGLIDVERFDSYNSIEDVENDREAYQQTLASLRSLKEQLGVTYIYALKYINGNHYFIFDTDSETDTLFDKYEISPVHERAFLGEESAGIMNVSDEYGDFNTGAIPIWKDGKVIGVISTDIEDVFIMDSISVANRNAVALAVSLFITMCALTLIVYVQQRNVRIMQDRLYRLANYDNLTGSPNRQYLMTYLEEVEKKGKEHTPFALLLIDLDNFKLVNDNEGHEAGDELLCNIAVYMDAVCRNVKPCNPTAGALNVSVRIGGDEFVQIVSGVNTEAEAQTFAKCLLDHFSSESIDQYIEKYKVGLSIGVALFPTHTENTRELIKFADIAMYYAKNSGKNTYRIYNPEMCKIDESDQSEWQKTVYPDRRVNNKFRRQAQPRRPIY